LFFVTKYVMVKQDHRTGCCPLGQRQIAFCDEKVTFFVIGHGSEPFMDLEEMVFLCIFVIPKNLQCLDIDESMNLTLGFQYGFLDRIGNSEHGFQKIIVGLFNYINKLPPSNAPIVFLKFSIPFLFIRFRSGQIPAYICFLWRNVPGHSRFPVRFQRNNRSFPHIPSL